VRKRPGKTRTHTAEERYRPTPDAPRKARHLVEEVLEAAGADELEATADLLTSELVSDAVRHSPSQIMVRAVVDPDVLRVEVTDDPGIVFEPGPRSFEQRARRRLVETMASRWGSDLDLRRTTTWFELALR
jgi:anti-sigma regulatory factor (Ser/Thr protein kinase)